MAQVKSYYSDQLELDREESPDAFMTVDEREDIIYELFLDQINWLLEEAATEDKQEELSDSYT
jgi:hypothetical protein